MKVVYIAGRFRGPDAWQRELNIRRAEEAALWVWSIGLVALCPHTNTRFFDGALPDHVWLDGDIELLKRCDAILMVNGWQDSTGACAEKVVAEQLGLPVFYEIRGHDLLFWSQRVEAPHVPR